MWIDNPLLVSMYTTTKLQQNKSLMYWTIWTCVYLFFLFSKPDIYVWQAQANRNFLHHIGHFSRITVTLLVCIKINVSQKFTAYDVWPSLVMWQDEVAYWGENKGPVALQGWSLVLKVEGLLHLPRAAHSLFTGLWMLRGFGLFTRCRCERHKHMRSRWFVEAQPLCLCIICQLPGWLKSWLPFKMSKT